METFVVNIFYKFTLNSIKINQLKYVNMSNVNDCKLYDGNDVKGQEKSILFLNNRLYEN